MTDVELDLAVARAMGHEQIAIGQPGIVMHIDIDEWPPQAQGWRWGRRGEMRARHRASHRLLCVRVAEAGGGYA